MEKQSIFSKIYRMRRYCLLISIVSVSVWSAGYAQLISIKSVPVATGEQFLLFPSANFGMGGISIALNDAMYDPYVNPAKGAGMQGSWLYSSPVHYNISDDFGSGTSLPMGVTVHSEKIFGGVTAAYQSIKTAPTATWWWGGNNQTLSDRSKANYYVFGMGGMKLSEGGSIGASIFYAGLSALDGVDLLYANSEKIDQSGHLYNVRIGYSAHVRNRRSYELLLIHNTVNMQHDVFYRWGTWHFNTWIPGPRTEVNLDETRTWGIHAGYVEHLPSSDWNIGGILTFNYKTHPKIPNYEIMNIPRDPGDTWAYNIGVGASKQVDMTTFGFDLIFEPIWSNTWADTDIPIETDSGKLIPVGGKTVENDFRFLNYLVRMGISRETDLFGVQLGLQMRTIGYHLEQTNFVEEFDREQRERWNEWTLSWGMLFNFTEFQLRYVGQALTGTGRPGVGGGWPEFGLRALAAGDFIVAPSGALTLQDALVMTHQLVVAIPIRY
jgi:hypothetical protein